MKRSSVKLQSDTRRPVTARQRHGPGCGRGAAAATHPRTPGLPRPEGEGEAAGTAAPALAEARRARITSRSEAAPLFVANLCPLQRRTLFLEPTRGESRNRLCAGPRREVT